MGRINRDCPLLRVVPPVSKRLADGVVGMGGIATLDDIIVVVRALTA
jgi:hypothetical protein